MTRLLLVIAIILGLGLSSRQAAAGSCVVDKYSHNGSLVDVQTCNGKVTITFTQLQQDLLQRGVRSGTIMFNGDAQANGAINGYARAFDAFTARCGAIAFAAAGARQRGQMILEGNVPVRDNSCQVNRFEANKLVFVSQGSNTATNPGPGPRPGPQTVTPTCPAGFVFSQGQCISAGAPQPGRQPGVAGTNVASVARTPVAGPGAERKLSGAELTTAIQQELNRLGCNTGSPDGDWGRRTRNAMGAFNRATKLNLDTRKPSDTALPVLKSTGGIICSAPARVTTAKVKKAAQPAKKKSTAGPAKKKEYWGGEDTRVACESGLITDKCF